MKRLLIGIALVLALVLPLSLPVTSQTSSSSSRRPVTTTFAALGTPANKEWRWCSDCNAASPCTSGGTGAFAYRVGSAWNCTNHLIGAGTGDALVANPLSQFAATTSAQLAGVLTNETGTGLAVFATTPTLTTPVLGVATATSINKVALTAPASSATLTIADGKTLTASNTLTLTGTDSSSVAFGAGGTVTYTIASGTSALGTSAISSGACASAVTTSATGTATTDAILWGFNGDPTGVTGYAPTTNGMLTIIAYPSANNVNYRVCNNTSASVTPGAITLNWRVVR